MEALPIFTLTPGGLLSLALTFVLPLIVGLVTKQSWTGWVKGVILLFVAFLKTLLEAWLTAINSHVDFDLVTVAYTTLVSFLIAVAAYFGLLKGTPLADAAQRAGVKD
jgi:hypothetical protein